MERGKGAARILGIDYGKARTGLAISDPTGAFAFELEMLPGGEGPLIERVRALMADYSLERAVMGFPRRTDGRGSDWADECERVAGRIRAECGLEVILRDERYTSVLAGQMLNETGARRQKRKSRLDTLSAAILLQDYLDERLR